MKKTIIFGIIFLICLKITYATGAPTPDHCLQESADEPTDCGGLANGSYEEGIEWSESGGFSQDFLYDDIIFTCGVRDTDAGEGTSYILIDYYKPEGAIQVETYWYLNYFNVVSSEHEINYGIIPIDCWNANPNIISIRLSSYNLEFGEGYGVSYECWDETEWDALIDFSMTNVQLCEESIYWWIDPELDSDSDGILDIYEEGDTDGDGIFDYLDDDDDNDGIPTADENADPNGDGNPEDALDNDDDLIPDYLDPDPIEEEEVEEEPECTVDADCGVGYECIGEVCVVIELEEEPLEVPIPVPVPPCVDTDNGQDYISQGTILSGLDKSDKCINSDKLRERYCITELTYTAEDVSCSELYGSGWGCEEGECIELKKVSKFPWWILIVALLVYYYYRQRKKKKKKK